ncbi:hypothetical protein B9Q04_20485 [Candidatus Marsarchaeota G2 archaeon BE_D]|uniref:Uncharacterized protein n=1 Tax=Candidatus Marsarchaeota G2 archaeon BE_D TaxID=1978158 RepID=A0A2R6BTH2_9ARCH|nr:MAG: hypothetical protein B9Q04_20485 [Candidatus Marsarchaeota G2 archaeon BE_D]
MRDAESAHNRVETNLTHRYSIIALLEKKQSLNIRFIEYIRGDMGQETSESRIISRRCLMYTRDW